jgi:hypothetical protein
MERAFPPIAKVPEVKDKLVRARAPEAEMIAGPVLLTAILVNVDPAGLKAWAAVPLNVTVPVLVNPPPVLIRSPAIFNAFPAIGKDPDVNVRVETDKPAEGVIFAEPELFSVIFPKVDPVLLKAWAAVPLKVRVPVL